MDEVISDVFHCADVLLVGNAGRFKFQCTCALVR